MQLIVIRHAEPHRVDAPGNGGGAADPGLTARGCEQAERLAAWLAVENVDHVVTSPLRRARETAAPLAAAFGLVAEVDDELREYDAGSDSYIPIEELRAAKSDEWYATINGRWDVLGHEPPSAVRDRVVPRFEDLIARFPGGTVAVVAHGGVINVYLAHVLGLEASLWFHPEYTSVSRVLAARSGPRSLVSLNDTAHLLATARARRTWTDG
ncbi:MAG TPA: histidine phosphatase family protein [Acidimicrobiia bacterium]|nr:histidine phosphatase family protein [Acidimicrobiia bacterium]